MNSPKRTALALFTAAMSALVPLSAIGQLAPIGAHHAGGGLERGGGGGYGLSVPLDFPGSRGGLPVPVSLVSGGSRMGAAGRGWDVPVSFVHEDRSLAHRRPTGVVGQAPETRLQVTLSLLGQTVELIGEGDVWVPQRGTSAITARKVGDTWKVYDGSGVTYVFGFKAGPDVWLLKEIDGAANAHVDLSYEITNHTLPGNQIGISFDLTHVQYNHALSGPFKHEIVLEYDDDAAKPWSMAVMGDQVVVRYRTLKKISVRSRGEVSGAMETIASYPLTYGFDPDTKLPRLLSAAVKGREGTEEANIALPLASYEYGTATTPIEGSSDRALKYQKKNVPIALPTGASGAAIASSTKINAGFPATIWGMPESLMDVTGDGRADMVFSVNGELRVARNRPGSSGEPYLGDAALTGPLFDGALGAMGSFLNTFETTKLGSSYGDYRTESITDTWNQFVDLNGDGRPDLLRANELTGYQWVAYINEPDATNPTNTHWSRHVYSVNHLATLLGDAGHILDGQRLPLKRQRSGQDFDVDICWEYNYSSHDWDQKFQSQLGPHTPGEFPACGLQESNGNAQVKQWLGESTFTEWDLTDINGDGGVDLLMNSSPVRTIATSKKPCWHNSPTAACEEPPLSDRIKAGRRHYRAGPAAGAANLVKAVYNLSVQDTIPHSDWVEFGSSAFGVGAWGRPYDDSRECTYDDQNLMHCPTEVSVPPDQIQHSAIRDINGDGLADWMIDKKVYLGTGRKKLGAYLDIPEAPVFSNQLTFNNQFIDSVCQGAQTEYTGSSTSEFRDVTGDGIPDHLSGHTVRIGTGAGFAAPVPIVSGAFTPSSVLNACDGGFSSTKAGLYDVDGDGKPEVVSLIGGHQLDLYQLVGSSGPRALSAGLLTVVRNAHGASTEITYKSAKDDATTLHQVASPEIVVSAVTSSLASTHTATTTRYAYGDARLGFDSIKGRFSGLGYGRSIVMSETGTVDERGQPQSTATVTDTYPLTMPSVNNDTKAAFGRHLIAGRPKDTTVLNGALPDPWSLLATDLSQDTRRIAGAHLEYDTRVSGDDPGLPNDLACFDIMSPYSLSDISWTNTCTTRGFAFTRASTSWRGTAAPPSLNNVMTEGQVLDVDAIGRVTKAYLGNDARRSDDDLCMETTYAGPSTGLPRVLSAVAEKRVGKCDGPGADKSLGTVLASQRLAYDGLPQGQVGTQGFVTSKEVDRRDSTTGALLDGASIREFDAQYDSYGNPSSVTTASGDGRSRTVTSTYDPFGLVALTQQTQATGAALLTTSATFDLVTLQPLTVTDANQAQAGTIYDGFGRPVIATIKPVGGTVGAVSKTSYLGFEGGTSEGRRVQSKAFDTPVPVNQVSVAQGRTATAYLDDAGRGTKTVVDLGSDYADDIVTGAVTYDAQGRAAFVADSFPLSQLNQYPAAMYGTTYFHNADGSPSCSIRGYGVQAFTTATDESTERYPTCQSRRYENGTEIAGVKSADALLAGSAQDGVEYTTTATAIGRLLSQATWRGTQRLEYADFGYDPLGQQTRVTRYGTPEVAQGPASPIDWTYSYDSLGQLLSLQEPNTVPRLNTYSAWGELLERRTPASTSPTAMPEQREVMTYDGLGRLIHSEQRSNGVVLAETIKDLTYDVGVSIHPAQPATNVLGRLASTHAATSETYFSYDGLGNMDAQAIKASDRTTYVETSHYEADGTLTEHSMLLPDTDYAVERVKYSVDSARRLREAVFVDQTNAERTLYNATTIDLFGRVRESRMANALYQADYADTGRRLMHEATVLATDGQRRTISFPSFDPVGRERTRTEKKNTAPAEVTTSTYDVLGRLVIADRAAGTTTLSHRVFAYDPLGNLLDQLGVVGGNDVSMKYRTDNRDQLCRIDYGTAGGTQCNVIHDGLGNIVNQPTRGGGTRELSYLPSGAVSSIHTTDGLLATFRYGFGGVEALDITGPTTDTRHDRRYGSVEQREVMENGVSKPLLSRNFSLGGATASRRGNGNEWVFAFGEARGNRYFVDQDGKFVQDVDYEAYGESHNSGAQPGSAKHSRDQWNGGDNLAAFGLSQLGARMYDPAIGRFLSADPLSIMRTSATSNPYAFAMNDPVNMADPSGMDACTDGNPLCVHQTYNDENYGPLAIGIYSGIMLARAISSYLDSDPGLPGINAPIPQPSPWAAGAANEDADDNWLAELHANARSSGVAGRVAKNTLHAFANMYHMIEGAYDDETAPIADAISTGTAAAMAVLVSSGESEYGIPSRDGLSKWYNLAKPGTDKFGRFAVNTAAAASAGVLAGELYAMASNSGAIGEAVIIGEAEEILPTATYYGRTIYIQEGRAYYISSDQAEKLPGQVSKHGASIRIHGFEEIGGKARVGWIMKQTPAEAEAGTYTLAPPRQGRLHSSPPDFKTPGEANKWLKDNGVNPYMTWDDM